jgi:anthranilate synthase/aminodeoxychorismate synthase-like glutamine amidotransferase
MYALIDNYDSFTYNLRDLLREAGLEVSTLPYDRVSLEELEQMPLEGLILSPGPGRPEEAPELMEIVEAFKERMPILGICLGHQALGLSFGASLECAEEPVHGKVTHVRHENLGVLNGIAEDFQAMRYHSLILKDLENSGFVATGHSPQGEVMVMQHKTLPLLGLQFHPESVLSEYGLQIIRNWTAIGKRAYSLDAYQQLV